MVVVRVGRGTADGVLVHDGHTGGQHLTHRRLEGRVHGGQHLMDVPADVLGGGHPVEAFLRRVDRDVAQVGVEHAQAYGRLGHEPGGQRQVPFDLAYRRLVRGEAQGVVLLLGVQQPHVAEFDHARAAVLVPDGEDADPADPRLHDLGEHVQHDREVLLVEQQAARVLAEGLLGGVTEQFLRLWAPQVDAALGVEEDGGHAQHVEQAARPGRGGRCLVRIPVRGLDRSHLRALLPAAAGLRPKLPAISSSSSTGHACTPRVGGRPSPLRRTRFAHTIEVRACIGPAGR